jgi:Zn-dependent peptidase ImmA (M78 family)
MTDLNVEYLPYARISQIADSFLATHNASGLIPVPIEEIVEMSMGLEIIPIPGLQKEYDIEGFTSSDFQTIYVDDFVFSNREYRYRFTLAHEVGHICLHRDILKDFSIDSVESWVRFVSTVNQDDYGTLELQGYDFGGLVLVPRNDLKRSFLENLEAFLPKIEKAKLAGSKRGDYLEYVLDGISTPLSREFNVSRDVIQRRIKKDDLFAHIP